MILPKVIIKTVVTPIIMDIRSGPDKVGYSSYLYTLPSLRDVYVH
jgi:hypothetical protein